MKSIPISHVVAALGFAALGVVAAIFVPESRWDKLADVISRIVADPAGATVAISLIAGAITTLRAAWMRTPPGDPPSGAPPTAGSSGGPHTRPTRLSRPTMAPRVLTFEADERRALDTSMRLLNAWHRETRQRIPRLAALHRAGAIALVVLALSLAGCGASALQTHATIAVAMEAGLGVSRPLLAPACDVAATSCAADGACLEHVARDCRAAVASWEVTHAAVVGYVEALQAAALADEGAVLDALAMVLSTTARTWAATVSALATVGVTLPSIPDAAAPLLATIGGHP